MSLLPEALERVSKGTGSAQEGGGEGSRQRRRRRRRRKAGGQKKQIREREKKSAKIELNQEARRAPFPSSPWLSNARERQNNPFLTHQSMRVEPLDDVSRVAAQNQLDLHRGVFRCTRRFREFKNSSSLLSLSLSLPAAHSNGAPARGACRGTSSSHGARGGAREGHGEGVRANPEVKSDGEQQRAGSLLSLCRLVSKNNFFFPFFSFSKVLFFLVSKNNFFFLFFFFIKSPLLLLPSYTSSSLLSRTTSSLSLPGKQARAHP